ncbi:MAG: hypothetical protein OXC54_02790 [Rhodospirillaceae bacterium]|nr:hypothetical protein [Rhodospirillaceae bacterium]MCY4310231.1 hypothetical protein [Rhodospirillaceae bacterium]
MRTAAGYSIRQGVAEAGCHKDDTGTLYYLVLETRLPGYAFFAEVREAEPVFYSPEMD